MDEKDVQSGEESPELGGKKSAKDEKEREEEFNEQKSGQKPEQEPDYRVLIDNLSDEDLRALFKKAQNADYYLDALQKAQADNENYRKRMEREMNNTRLYAGQDIFRQLLGLLDDFQRAIALGNQGAVEKNFFEGICLVEKEFQKVLNNFGVKPIEAVGKPFDPNYHEAMSQLPDPNHPPMTVIQEYDKGYLYRDRVLRPSKVVVSCAPKKEEQTAEPETTDDLGNPQSHAPEE